MSLWTQTEIIASYTSNMQAQYTGLSLGRFRLLTVVPGCGDRDLRFHLTNAALDIAPEYTAVSYAWGSQAATEIIYIDDNPFRIRPNLWACLHCLRRVWKYIWADAICIDQNNTTEKNEQVRQMGKIYANAKIVSVWLGLVPLPEGLLVRGPVITLEVDDFDWAESLDDLASRAYWSRSWVVQEFLLARDIHLYCSNTRVDYSSFQDMLLDGADLQLGDIGVDLLVTKPELVRKWPALPLVVQRHVDRFPDLYQPLYDLLASHAYTQSTDPKDKVFSLLGLVPVDERNLLQRSFPNYKLSEDQVNIVTLGHLRVFAPGQSLRPIFRALNIPAASAKMSRLAFIVERFDYLSDTDPAQQAQRLLEFYSTLEMIPEVEPDRFAPCTYFHDPVSPIMASTLDELIDRRDRTFTRRCSRWFTGGIVLLASACVVLYLFARDSTKKLSDLS